LTALKEQLTELGRKQMSVWFALLDGPQNDVVHVKHLSRSKFTFDEIDGKFALSAPAFQHCNDDEQVITASTDLLAAINTSLRLSVKAYTGFELHGVAEKRDDGVVHRTMIAKGATYSISGAAAVIIAGSIGSPARSREERLISLIQRDPAIADVANAMAVRPLTWAAMNAAYESVKGLASTKATSETKRKDHQGLVDRQWISAEHSESFYCTAGFHRHGHPKVPIKAGVPEMSYDDASRLIVTLFWRLVDHLEPH
jgi:hypothetical protein